MKEEEKTPAPTFEQAIEELEAIVAEMEDGALPLEESVEKYRRGIELVGLCRAKLAQAEETIRELEEQSRPRNLSSAPRQTAGRAGESDADDPAV